MEKTKHAKRDFIMTGDVQCIESKLPTSAKIIQRKIVAYGEKSNHVHVITGDYEMFEDENKDVFVKMGKLGGYSQHVHESIWKKANFDTMEELQKADHKPAKLMPNKVYRIGIHKAYDPYQKIRVNVAD